MAQPLVALGDKWYNVTKKWKLNMGVSVGRKRGEEVEGLAREDGLTEEELEEILRDLPRWLQDLGLQLELTELPGGAE